jgi:glycosyltransferase involved in cell wall biosynthesis
MQPRPEFSIVTASFGQLPWLRLCIASVADQSGPAREHLIQDGGSGPELQDVIYGRPHLSCVQEPDSGMYDALNRGFRRARGKFVAWLNCDEQYLPGVLEKVVSFFDRHPDIDVVYGDALLLDLHGRPLSYRRVVTPERNHTRLDHLGTLSCATFFRRSIIDRGFLFDPRWRSIGDAVWIESLLHAGIPMATIRQPLAVYTFTGKNLSASARASSEMAVWREQSDSLARRLHAATILKHRLRKLLAGAYRKRAVSYSIYTSKSPTARVLFESRTVGFGWPGETAPSPPGCERKDSRLPEKRESSCDISTRAR